MRQAGRFRRVTETLAIALALTGTASRSGAAAAESPQTAAIARIVDEGLNRSEVLKTASDLFDGIGPRLTNSENMRRAQDWAMERVKSYGAANVHLEPFYFGLGWNLDSYSATLTTPRHLPLTIIPVAWSPATSGVMTAQIIVAPMTKEEHFAAWKGKLKGKIVLVSKPGETSESKEGPFKRLSDKEIGELDHFDAPHFDPLTKSRWDKAHAFSVKLSAFLKDEGAVAVVTRAYRDGKLVSGEGYQYDPGHTLALPTVQMAQEDYGKLVRLATMGRQPELSLSINARFDDKTLDASNLVFEIPGSDPKAGFVMAGAHFDSWIAADGATDNGAGSVAMIEAARLLHKLGLTPRRTIRFVLWSGEEQGELGSIAYVDRHFASRPIDPKLASDQKAEAWEKAFPITIRPEYAAMKAYFNIDNGSGRLRGIYDEGNVGVSSLLSEWMAPFRPMGAASVVSSRTHGTDHEKFQAVGLPGYQFVQDPLDYESRVHHSTLDTLDHMRGEDMRQMSVVLAGVLWQAANADKELPHQPLPTQPSPTDPFKVADPDQ